MKVSEEGTIKGTTERHSNVNLYVHTFTNIDHIRDLPNLI